MTLMKDGSASASFTASDHTSLAVLNEVAWAHDVRFGGAEMDDPTVNNNTAFRAGFDVLNAAGGGELNFVPGKTYGWSTGSAITSKHGITLKGNGATLQHIPSGVSLDNGTFGVWTKCNDLKIVDFDIDLNNIERFGGFQIQGCARPLVQNVYAFDTNLNSSWASYDHYAFVFNKSDDGTPSSDVKMYDIQADDCELVEADFCHGFTLSRFVSNRAAGTIAVGWFSVVDGQEGYDYEISHGRIVDARKRWMSISHETAGANSNTTKRFNIHDVKLLKTSNTGGTSSMLLIGNTGSSATGNVYEDFNLEDILMYVDPALTQLVTPAFKVNVVSANSFLRARMKNITVVADSGASEFAVDLRRLKDSDVDIKVRGATYGLSLANPLDSRIKASVQGSTMAISQGTSLGGNTLNTEVYGASTTPYSVTLAAGDMHTKAPLVVSQSWDPASIADGSFDTVDVTVTGALVGDLVEVTYTADILNMILTGRVRVTNSVRVMLSNESGSARDVTGTLKVIVRKIDVA